MELMEHGENTSCSFSVFSIILAVVFASGDLESLAVVSNFPNMMSRYIFQTAASLQASQQYIHIQYKTFSTLSCFSAFWCVQGQLFHG